MSLKPFIKSANSEKILFFLVAVANLYPLITVKYIGSLDGPSHLYISNVIAQLWKHNQFYDLFFKINPLYIGNSLGIFLLAGFNFLFPDWVAEKIFICCYLIGYAYSFRYLVISVKGKATVLSFLIFPFAYTSLFMLGYYNYSIAIAVMMWAFGYWIRIEKNLSVQRLIVFAFLALLLYYSHIFVFVFFLLSLGLYFVFNSIIYIIKNKNNNGVYTGLIVRASLILLSTLPGILLGFFYYKSMSGENLPVNLRFSELTDSLFKFKILIGYVTDQESVYTSKIFILLFFLFVFQIAYRGFLVFVVSKKNKNEKPKSLGLLLFEKNDFWLLLTLIMLTFYFAMPERLSAGNISTRIGIIATVFLVIWIAVQNYPKYVAMGAILIFALLAVNLRLLHVEPLQEMDKSISEIREVSDRINDSTVYVSANYSPGWLHYHFQSYVGSEKSIIDINSPECTDQFAANWNDEDLPFAFIGSMNASLFSYVYVNKPQRKSTVIAEYAVIVGNNDFNKLDLTDGFKKVILHDYGLVYKSSNGFVALYKLMIKNDYQKIEKQLYNSPGLMMNIRAKAKEYDIPVKEMVTRDALWMYNRSWY